MKYNFAKWITVLLVGLLTLALLTACEGMGQSTSTLSGDETTGDNPNETAEHDCAKDGHIEMIDAAVAPTCTETGLTEGKHCSVCETVLVAQQVVKAKGHTEITDAAVEPTCTETGLTEGKHCSVCKTVLVAQETVVPVNHSYGSDGYCTYHCGTHAPSEGLEYILNTEGTSYIVIGFGVCKDTEIYIPSKYLGLPVTSIIGHALAGYKNMTSITIPDSVTSIGEYVFYGCSRLKTITIGNGLTSIGSGAFLWCSSIRITFDGTKEQWKAIEKSSSWKDDFSGTVVCTDGEISY